MQKMVKAYIIHNYERHRKCAMHNIEVVEAHSSKTPTHCSTKI